MERAPGRNVIAANSSLLESGEYSDFIIRCGGKDFKVHKVIVCPQSSFFKAALAGGFKVSGEIYLAGTSSTNLFAMYNDSVTTLSNMRVCEWLGIAGKHH